MCVGNRGQSISRDLFRPNEIRLHADAPERWTPSEGETLLRLLKGVGANWGETSWVFEGRGGGAIKNPRHVGAPLKTGGGMFGPNRRRFPRGRNPFWWDRSTESTHRLDLGCEWMEIQRGRSKLAPSELA
jgi:hypothetical protein